MRVLVTGAAGFLGSAVCRAAAARGDVVSGVVRSGELSRPVQGVEYREIEWGADPGILTRLMDEHEVEAVVHCAGATPRAIADTVALYDANVRVVWVMLSALAAARTSPSAVVVSSAAVYGSGAPVPTGEDAALSPESHYASSKVLAEEAVSGFVRAEDLRVSIARPFNLLGSGEPAGSVVSDVVDQLQASPTASHVRIREGESVRDYVDVDDAALALLLLAEKGVPGEAYNVCTGKGASVRELVDTILSVWESAATIQITDPSPSSSVSIGSPDKIRSLGWDSRTSLQDSVERIRERLQAGRPEA